jgi:hypothetical protein
MFCFTNKLKHPTEYVYQYKIKQHKHPTVYVYQHRIKHKHPTANFLSILVRIEGRGAVREARWLNSEGS